MYRVGLIAVWLGLGGCCSRAPQVTTTGCTHHKVPGDPTPLAAAFAEADGACRYVVLAYGREGEVQAKSDHVVVDGRRVDVPATGKTWVLSPGLRLHESGVSPADLKAPLWAGDGGEFFAAGPWQRDLYPLLKTHRWGGGPEGK